MTQSTAESAFLFRDRDCPRPITIPSPSVLRLSKLRTLKDSIGRLRTLKDAKGHLRTLKDA